METKGWGLKPSVCLIWMPAAEKGPLEGAHQVQMGDVLGPPSLGEEQAVSHCTPLLSADGWPRSRNNGCGSPGLSGTGRHSSRSCHRKAGVTMGSMRHQGNTSLARPLPVGVEVPIQAAGLQGIHPALVVEILAPGVELGPMLPGPLQHVGQAAVPPGEDSLQISWSGGRASCR